MSARNFVTVGAHKRKFPKRRFADGGASSSGKSSDRPDLAILAKQGILPARPAGLPPRIRGEQMFGSESDVDTGNNKLSTVNRADDDAVRWDTGQGSVLSEMVNRSADRAQAAHDAAVSKAALENFHQSQSQPKRMAYGGDYSVDDLPDVGAERKEQYGFDPMGGFTLTDRAAEEAAPTPVPTKVVVPSVSAASSTAAPRATTVKIDMPTSSAASIDAGSAGSARVPTKSSVLGTGAFDTATSAKSGAGANNSPAAPKPFDWKSVAKSAGAAGGNPIGTLAAAGGNLLGQYLKKKKGSSGQNLPSTGTINYPLGLSGSVDDPGSEGNGETGGFDEYDDSGLAEGGLARYAEGGDVSPTPTTTTDHRRPRGSMRALGTGPNTSAPSWGPNALPPAVPTGAAGPTPRPPMAAPQGPPPGGIPAVGPPPAPAGPPPGAASLGPMAGGAPPQAAMQGMPPGGAPGGMPPGGIPPGPPPGVAPGAPGPGGPAASAIQGLQANPAAAMQQQQALQQALAARSGVAQPAFRKGGKVAVEDVEGDSPRAKRSKDREWGDVGKPAEDLPPEPEKKAKGGVLRKRATDKKKVSGPPVPKKKPPVPMVTDEDMDAPPPSVAAAPAPPPAPAPAAAPPGMAKGGKCDKMAAGGVAKIRRGFPNTKVTKTKRMATGGSVRGCGVASRGKGFSGVY